MVNTSLNNNNSVANNNGHYHHQSQQQQHQLQRQPNSSTASSAVMFPSTSGGNCNNDYMQAMSWTDRPLSGGTIASILSTGTSNNGISSNGKMQLGSNSTNSGIPTTSAAENHSFHPFVPNDGVSAAFNLQQLHQGICSVGAMPSWQQAFTFNDCNSTSVPSQNDDGNDTRSLPMPLSMSNVPTSSASNNNHLTNEPHSSIPTTNNPDHHYINRIPNLQCPSTTSSTTNNNNNNSGMSGSESMVNGGYSNNGNQLQAGNTYANSSNGALTLTFSASLVHGADNQHGSSMPNQQTRSPQHSPLPPYSTSVASTPGHSESTPD